MAAERLVAEQKGEGFRMLTLGAAALLLEKHQVTFLWVKGHADNPGNERCDDELARMAIQNGALQEDENYGKM